MTTEIDVECPAATMSGTAPVAMQRGGHSDRIALARLRGGRRWLVRDRDKAGLAPDPPTERLGIHEIEVSVVSPKGASTASPSSGPALADARAGVRMRSKGPLE
jgi:hypothetical protein